jgi:hypothetical protein
VVPAKSGNSLNVKPKPALLSATKTSHSDVSQTMDSYYAEVVVNESPHYVLEPFAVNTRAASIGGSVPRKGDAAHSRAAMYGRRTASEASARRHGSLGHILRPRRLRGSAAAASGVSRLRPHGYMTAGHGVL